jgi:TatD DNase family protein
LTLKALGKMFNIKLKNPSMLVDSHCHLDYYSKEDRDLIIQNAVSNGVKILQTIGTKFSASSEILEIADKYDFIYASVGTHPENALIDKVSADDIIKLCNLHSKKITGIGETGLDYYHSTENIDIQKICFKEHIRASQETGKVLIVHTRNADDDTLEILKQAKKEKDFKILMHCFTGGVEFGKKLLDIGAFISYSGIVTFKNAKDVIESMLNTPSDRLLIETDSPFLAPAPMRGKRNEPAFLRHTAEFIAQKREVSFEELSNQTYNNYQYLFL